MQRHRPIGGDRGGGARLYRLKSRANRGFELLRIDVADRHDRHLIGPIPGVVKGAEPRGGRAPEDLGLTDRQALGIAGLVVQDGELLVADP